MKKIVFTIFLCLVAAQSNSAQNPQSSETQKLNREIADLYQKGKYDKAISLAEKLVENERKSNNPQNLATALTNLAILRKERFQAVKRELAATEPEAKAGIPRAQMEARIAKGKNMGADGEVAEKLFREVLEIYQTKLKTETAQLATAQNELAWLTYNYFKAPETQTDAATRTDNARARIDEAEKLFTQALALREKLLGAEDDATLATVFDFAEFYRKWVNYEKAMPLYNRFLTVEQKKYGANDKNIVPALRAYAQLLVTTDGAAEAAETVKQISAITGKPETLPEANENVTLRIARSDLDRLNQLPINEDVLRRYRGAIRIRVTIGENGKIAEADALVDDDKLKAKIEESIRRLNFRPFQAAGGARKIRGYVSYAQLPL